MGWTLSARATLTILLACDVGIGCGESLPTHILQPHCSLGSLRDARALIRPTSGTFYSVDALNPDVVAYRGQYLMYFSGNSVPSADRPRWKTGLAVATHPMGPFRLDSRFRGAYLNGGTAIWRGRLWHLVEHGPASANELAVSTDGRRWRHVAWLPSFRLGRTAVVGSDFYLAVERGELAAYMFLVRPKPTSSAFTIGRVRFDGRRWNSFAPVLRHQPSRWYEAYDLGEPAVFRSSRGLAMLYVGTAADGVRSISMAVLRNGKWIRCANNPLISPGSGWARTIAIDPSVLRAGATTYVYYGGAPTKGLGSDLGGAIGVARYRGRGSAVP